ncbi:MAG: hypothetical protein FWD19_03595, partial [Defluviitaleaceae bacterium]|nr:hypothetical protein [Defluviitaleaceae bacterium]
LGDGTTITSYVPVQVMASAGVPLSGITAIAGSGGGYFSLAQKDDGTVWAWGSNREGQLGVGNAIQSRVPVQVKVSENVVLTGITKIAAGENHTVALRNDRTVWVWGDNQQGQLGLVTAPWVRSLYATQVTGLSNIEAIAAGANHTVVCDGDGNVWTWGRNSHGQLGDGSLNNIRTLPEQIEITTSAAIFITDVSAGNNHTIALDSDRNVWAWGNNINGQIGDNTTANQRTTPVRVLGSNGLPFINVTAIAAGGDHNVILRQDGTVWTWGLNTSGQLGDNTMNDAVTPRRVPVRVFDLNNITSIAAGGFHTAVIGGDLFRPVWTWGRNESGQIGNGIVHPAYPIRWRVRGSDGGFLRLRTLTNAEAVEEDVKWLTWDRIKRENISMAEVKGRLNLFNPNMLNQSFGPEGSTIEWSVNPNNDVITISTGAVKRPVFGSGDTDVVLTAKIFRENPNSPRDERIINFPLTIKQALPEVKIFPVFPDPPLAEWAINLTHERIEKPNDFIVKAYSVNGGKTWKGGALPTTQTKLSRLFNKDLELWVSNQWNPKTIKSQGITKGVPLDDPLTVIIKFPPIQKRAKIGTKLRPFYHDNKIFNAKTYSDTVWVLAYRNDAIGTPVHAGFEYAVSSKGKPLHDEWTEVSDNGFGLDKSGTPKTTYLIRTKAVVNGDDIRPARKAYKVTPATFRKTPAYKLRSTADNVMLILKKGETYSFDGINFKPPLFETTTRVTAEEADGRTIYVKIAATGKKPASEVQTLGVPAP